MSLKVKDVVRMGKNPKLYAVTRATNSSGRVEISPISEDRFIIGRHYMRDELFLTKVVAPNVCLCGTAAHFFKSTTCKKETNV